MTIMRLVALLLFVWGLAQPSQAAALQKGDLAIVAGDGHAYTFEVEIARSAEQQERGLMFRKSMPEDSGMIFPQDSDRTMSFWMKNTYIPLDIIFINADGHIRHIAPNATPLSETTIPSGGPIRAVLELNGGVAAKLGIHVGDLVRFPGLGRD
jgi:uncharacterized membrane protein (UPF0127 family)